MYIYILIVMGGARRKQRKGKEGERLVNLYSLQ